MNNIMQIGIALVAFDKMSKVIGEACGKATQHFTKLQEKIKQTSEKLAEVGTISYFSGQQILQAMQKPIAAFMELEEASTQLKVTLMRDGGEISEAFHKIDKIAMELGNRLPGTTSDFYKMASSLKALGVTEESIAGGALEAAAKLGVVLKPLGATYEEAAVSVAKFKEALGIADNELIKFMDLIQRVAHQGVKLEEMRYALADLAGTLQPLGLHGLDVAKSMTPLVAMLIKTGRTGREVGNAISDMIRQSMDVDRLSKANQMLAQFGIELSFIDEQTGKFKGIENLIVQLDRLKELPDVVRVQAFKALFGVGAAADVANIIASKGVEGYNDMIDAMARQADLNRRVELSLATLKNVWESFTGTLQNAFAIIGEAVAPQLKKFVDMLNTLTGRLGEFAKDHATLTRIITIGGLAVGGSLVAFGALGIALSVIFRTTAYAIDGIMKFTGFIKMAIPWIRLKAMEIWRLIGMQRLMEYIQYRGGFWKAMQYWLMTTKFRILEAIGALRAWAIAQLTAFRASFLTVTGLQNMARALSTTLLAGLKAAIAGIKAFSVALLSSPVFWIGFAIVGVALLIYKLWKPISGFFKGLFQGIAEALKGLEPAWDIFKKLTPLLFPILIPLRLIYNLIKWLIKPVDDTGKAAENLGLRFGRAIGNILSSILTLPAKMFTAGAKIVEALWQGMNSFINKPVEAIKGLVQKIRNLLPLSPAKEGPLKDIHRVRIIETIAETLKPAPMIAGMTKVMGVVKTAVEPIMQPVKQVFEPVKAVTKPLIQPLIPNPGAPIPKPEPRSTVIVNYNPTITFSGALSTQAKEDFAQMLRQHQRELLRLIQDAQAKQARVLY